MHSLRHPIRFISIFALVLSAVFMGNAGTAAAANPLLCFDGTTDGGFNGHCVITADGAVLDTADGDADPNNAYAGVYYEVTSLGGELVGDVSDVSFDYECADGIVDFCVTGGSPRVSIPIDTDADGTTESYAFIDAANCGQTGDMSGTVDLSCPVFFGSTLYANWAAFAAANPTYRIATDAVPFVIADQPFRGTVSDVQLGQAEDVASDKDECKDGGWEDMTRADGSSFKNQGDCIQYVNTGK
jgi:hypothetical protein